MISSPRALAARTFELTDFLVNIAKLQDVPGGFSGNLTYHDSCSGLRELGVKQQSRALLAQLPDATLKEMAQCETCCGFGGAFSIKFDAIKFRICSRNIITYCVKPAHRRAVPRDARDTAPAFCFC